MNWKGEAGGEAATLRVWDPFVRLFHWSLVALFAVAFVTGEEIERLHEWAGYGVAALVAMRVVWGFVGPRYARFSDFVKGPRAVWTFLKQSARLEAPRYLGHNPAGGAMVVTLLVVLAALCGTGIAMTVAGYAGSKPLEEIHEALANIALGLVVVHVLGVALASWEYGENLARAMVTGRKRGE